MRLLATYGFGVLRTEPLGVALLVLAMLAFAIDVQTGVTRFWTAVGAVALVVGSFTLYDGHNLSWLTLLAGIALTLVAMLSGLPALVRTRFATTTIGRDWMIGEIGETVSAADPDGVVRIKGALWRARVNRVTPLAVGEPARVVSIDGLVLEVEPLEGGARDYRELRSRHRKHSGENGG